MRRRIALSVLTLLLAPSLASADAGVCRTDPLLVGPCFSLHGVLFAANGAPTFRIRRTGTSRILGIRDSENPVMPANLHARLLETGDAFDVRISADYLVCPYTRGRKGRMQFVCIERASHIALTREAR
jgi:hypothetical protein